MYVYEASNNKAFDHKKLKLNEKTVPAVEYYITSLPYNIRAIERMMKLVTASESVVYWQEGWVGL